MNLKKVLDVDNVCLLEDLLKEHFGLDPKKIEHRVAAGRVIVAWMAAKTRAT